MENREPSGTFETQLRAWGAELDKLKARADKQIAEVKKDYYEHIEELRDEIEAQLKKWGAEVEGTRARAETEAQAVIRELRAKIEAALREWGPEIAALKARADQAEADARKVADEVKATLKALKARLGELRHASGGAWEEVRIGMGRAWDELKPALQNAIAKFK